MIKIIFSLLSITVAVGCARNDTQNVGEMNYARKAVIEATLHRHAPNSFGEVVD